jgi:hypothetical protein
MKNIWLYSKSLPFYAVIGPVNKGPHTMHKLVIKSRWFSSLQSERFTAQWKRLAR